MLPTLFPPNFRRTNNHNEASSFLDLSSTTLCVFAQLLVFIMLHVSAFRQLLITLQV